MLRKDIEAYMKDNGLKQIDLILHETDKLAIYCSLIGGTLKDYTGHVVDRKLNIWGRLVWKDGKSERKAWQQMKYFFISDIHGEYSKMMDALTAAGFNKNTDTLVSLGDPFDRGYDNLKVLQFLMSCPHRILIWGNHDARLAVLLHGTDFLSGNDIENGIGETLRSFTDLYHCGLDMCLYLLKDDPGYAQMRDLLWSYFRECHWAVEFPNLIATHAWLPTVKREIDGKEVYFLADNWRSVDKNTWYLTSWCDSLRMAYHQCVPEKPLLIGHYHAWRFANAFGEKRFPSPSIKQMKDDEPINCDSWASPDGRLITIDGCAYYWNGGKVNVYVYESDAEPTLIGKKIYQKD